MFAKTMFTVAFATGVLVAGAPRASAIAKLQTVSFGGSGDLQSWVAEDRGLFAKEGLSVTLATTSGSVQEVRDLLSGKFQIMSSAFDNIVAYTEGEGETTLAQPPDMIAFMAVHSGLISLISRPDIKSIEAIRGKRVAVDALKTGYALVLYRLLRDRGLEMNKDYSIIGVGGTPARMKAMEDAKAVAAMLSPPVDLAAEKAGYNVLASSREIGPYQGSVYATRRSWAKGHETEMSAYIRAIVAATDYIFANKAGAIAVLKKHEPRLSDEALEKLYATLTGPGGFNPHAALDMAGVKTVLDLRQANSESGKRLDPPSKYIDVSYYKRALAPR